MHLLHNVTPSNEISLHIQLRNRGPVAEFFDAFSNILILQYVHIFVLLDAIKLKDLNDIVAETASRHFSVSFHE